MAALTRMMAALLRVSTGLLPTDRRVWVQALSAEAASVPAGRRRLAWLAGGAWLAVRQSVSADRLGYPLVLAAAAGTAWSAWSGPAGDSAVAINRVDVIAIAVMLAGLPWGVRLVRGPVANTRLARAVRGGGYAAVLVLVLVKAAVERVADAPPNNAKGAAVAWLGEAVFLLVMAGYAAVILVSTARRSPASPGSVTIGIGTGVAIGVVAYALGPLGCPLRFAGFWPSRGYDAAMAAGMLLAACAPVAAGLAAARRAQPSGSRAGQGAIAGLGTGAAAALVVAVMSTATIALLPHDTGLRDWAVGHVDHWTPVVGQVTPILGVRLGYVAGASSFAAGYLFVLLLGPLIGCGLGAWAASATGIRPLWGRRHDHLGQGIQLRARPGRGALIHGVRKYADISRGNPLVAWRRTVGNSSGGRRSHGARVGLAVAVAILVVIGGGSAATIALLSSSSTPAASARATSGPGPSVPPSAVASPVPIADASPVSSPAASPSGTDSASAGPAHWTYPVPIDQQADQNDNAIINSVSCVTAVTCYAVDSDGNVLASTAENSWRVVNTADSGTNLTAISCASAGDCVVVDNSGQALILSDGSWNDPVTIDSGNQLNDVSCPTTTFCIAVNNVGRGFVFRGSDTRWSPVTIDPDQDSLTSVSCPTTAFCVVVDDTGNEYTYQAGKWGSGSQVDGYGSFTQVSCSSASFCVAIDQNGNPVTMARGNWSARTVSWTTEAISCPADGYCAAVDGSGGVRYYRNGSWSGVTKIAGNDVFSSISCVAENACVAVDQDDNVMYYGPAPDA